MRELQRDRCTVLRVRCSAFCKTELLRKVETSPARGVKARYCSSVPLSVTYIPAWGYRIQLHTACTADVLGHEFNDMVSFRVKDA